MGVAQHHRQQLISQNGGLNLRHRYTDGAGLRTTPQATFRRSFTAVSDPAEAGFTEDGKMSAK